MHSPAWAPQMTPTQSSQFEFGTPGVLQGVAQTSRQSVGGPPEPLEPLPLEPLEPLEPLPLELLELPDVTPQAQSRSFL